MDLGTLLWTSFDSFAFQVNTSVISCIIATDNKNVVEFCGRHVCTTLMAVLGKCMRPVEALNVFNVMCVSSDGLKPYSCISVLLKVICTNLLLLVTSVQAFYRAL